MEHRRVNCGDALSCCPYCGHQVYVIWERPGVYRLTDCACVLAAKRPDAVIAGYSRRKEGEQQ